MWPHKSHHYVKVGIPSGAAVCYQKPKIIPSSTNIEKLLVSLRT
jgi:hypothetical protein